MSITPKEYGQFQQNISDFLRSEQASLFSIEHFATTVANNIARDIAQYPNP
jgi:hypothetical protein